MSCVTYKRMFRIASSAIAAVAILLVTIGSAPAQTSNAADSESVGSYAPRSSSIDFTASGRLIHADVVPLIGSSPDETWEAETMSKIRQANAPWLLMHGREYERYATSYTYELSLAGDKDVREYPYTGPYDRGSNFRPPSEWLVYFMDASSCSHARKDGNLVFRYGKHGWELPWFSTEVDLWPGSMPQAWDALRSGTPTQFPPMLACKVFVDEESYRIVREQMTFNNWDL